MESDNGREFCGRPDEHPCEQFPAAQRHRADAATASCRHRTTLPYPYHPTVICGRVARSTRRNEERLRRLHHRKIVWGAIRNCSPRYRRARFGRPVAASAPSRHRLRGSIFDQRTITKLPLRGRVVAQSRLGGRDAPGPIRTEQVCRFVRVWCRRSNLPLLEPGAHCRNPLEQSIR